MVKMNKVCQDILIYLHSEYERKGHNFFFSAKKINIKKYSNHLKGNALGRLSDFGDIDNWKERKSHPKLYKTRFLK